MAREQRAMLRETILMGITRLVVQKGNVKASVLFDIKASEEIQKGDKAALQEQTSNSRSITASGGFLGSLVPGVTGGGTHSERKIEAQRVVGQKRREHGAGREDHRLGGHHVHIRLLQARQFRANVRTARRRRRSPAGIGTGRRSGSPAPGRGRSSGRGTPWRGTGRALMNANGARAAVG